MHNSPFYVFLKKYVVPLLAIIYLLNPLQRQLLEEMHTLSHVLAHTDFHHHHDEHYLLPYESAHEHTHEHKMIAFFTKIFSAEKDHDDHDEGFFSYTLDKHFAQKYLEIKFELKTINKHLFFYTPKKYVWQITIPTPPPEIFFS